MMKENKIKYSAFMKKKKKKVCVQHETMQSSLREPNDVGLASPSNLRTNKISCN